MRVLMLLTGSAPFGNDWARAAATVADVITVDFSSEAAGEPVAPGVTFVGGSPPSYRIAGFSLRPRRVFGPAADRVLLRRLLRAVDVVGGRHGRIDLLHTHFYPNARWMPAVKRATGIPYVHTEHSSSLTLRSAAHKRLSAAGLRMARHAYLHSSKVIAVSDYMRSCMRELGLPGDFTVIGNPVDVDLFSFRERPARTTVELVCVGRLEADRRPGLVLEAFARALAVDPRLRLQMIGAGPSESEAKSLCRALGVDEFVTFTGLLGRAEVAERVATSDALVSASVIETFGLSVAEALCCGVPVVAVRVPALEELVDAGNGVLVDAEADALCAGLLDTVDNLARFDGQAMSSGVAGRFSHGAIGDALNAVYEASVVPSG